MFVLLIFLLATARVVGVHFRAENDTSNSKMPTVEKHRVGRVRRQSACLTQQRTRRHREAQ